jgi:hypothetical protein
MRLLILTMATTLCVHAQWLDRPTPGTPRLANGKPNLSAAAPRTGGKPNLSGVWQVEGSEDGAGLGESRESNYLVNFFADFKSGEEPFQPAAAAQFRQPPGSRKKLDLPCPPARLPFSDLLPIPFKIVQTPDLTLVLYEDFENFRQIHTDGRNLPVDPQPAFLGYSVGKWEGGIFVVKSAGFNGLLGIDGEGHPNSEAMQLTERFHRLDFGHMDLQITVDDPRTYTKPVTVNVHLYLLPDTDLIESVCEDEKDKTHLAAK